MVFVGAPGPIVAQTQSLKETQRVEETAESHHQAGVAYHLRRCLDDASREYTRALELDPPRDLTDEEWQLARRFAPRIYVTASEFFPLKDFAVILHPTARLIAYHFFWEDDIDFPEDNDPCDHELMWVRYSPDRMSIEEIWTYFHGRMLAGGEAALADARRNRVRPRVNVQWGKHGSMPAGWEELKIIADRGDAENKYYPVDQPISLKVYNEGTFRKLSEEGRRLPNHPLGRRAGWPQKFSGKWGDFANFSRIIEPLDWLEKNKMAAVSLWNSATINQHFLRYNFRPKTEWPVDDFKSHNSDEKSATPIRGTLSLKELDQSLLEKRFRVETEAEVLLDLRATAPHTSWGEAGSEAAAATVSVDGQYNQDVFLFAGERAFTYQVLLGHFQPGEHTLRVDFNRKRSAAKATAIEIQDAKISLVDRTSPEYQALSLTPIVYARPNTIGRFSDIPLLMWYETERTGPLTTIRYSVIFTNEDGGTQTSALMARWGRTTDIEWVYEVQIDAQGKVQVATFQGVEHKTQNFKGKEENGHPALYVVSDNNNVSDHGESEMRFASRPIPFDLSHSSREEIMDRHPWIYQLMAAELQREGKISETSRGGSQMADPRHYLYLDAASELSGTALSFAIKLKENPKWYESDLGINYYRIDRSGYFRTTVRLPAGTRLDQIERIAVRCDAAGNPRSGEEIKKLSAAECGLNTVNKAFMLDASFQPGPSLPVHIKPLKLRFGEAIEVYYRRGASVAGGGKQASATRTPRH